MPLCDGCGANVEEAHIRSRIERLEMATRFRPIHIQVLLLDSAPLARPEDFFYREAVDRSERSVESRSYFDALIKCTGADPAGFSQEADALAEFQRQGLFLTNVVECSAAAELDAALGRCAPSLVKRVQFSYKPKYIALISTVLGSLVPMLSRGGWADRLILNAGVPFELGWAGGAKELAKGVTEKLAKVSSGSA